MHVLKPFGQQLLTQNSYQSRGNDIFDWAGADVMVHLPYLADRRPEKNACYGPGYLAFFSEPVFFSFFLSFFLSSFLPSFLPSFLSFFLSFPSFLPSFLIGEDGRYGGAGFSTGD